MGGEDKEDKKKEITTKAGGQEGDVFHATLGGTPGRVRVEPLVKRWEPGGKAMECE